MRKFIVPFLLILLTLPLTLSNPIPTIIVSEECIGIEFYVLNGGYYATVHGSYSFKNEGYKAVKIVYPIPPNAEEISITVEGSPVEWKVTNSSYLTVSATTE